MELSVRARWMYLVTLNGTYKHAVSMPDWTCKAKTTKVRLREGGALLLRDEEEEKRKKRRADVSMTKLCSSKWLI